MKLMGIVNVTPDSFSDGGRFFDCSLAVEHALELIKAGADIIDIGGESTRPGALPVSVDEELRRVLPVIEDVRKKSDIPISIDTTKSIVAKHSIDAGASMINDISAGRFDPEIFSVVASTKVPICLMHMQGLPQTMQINPHYENIISEIHKFLLDAISRATEAGISREQIIIDPGIGFGKTPEDNIEIIRHLDKFLDLRCPILIGTSKKSFIGKLLDLEVDKRFPATLATLAVAIEKGAHIFRVHDIAPARHFLDMFLMCK